MLSYFDLLCLVADHSSMTFRLSRLVSDSAGATVLLKLDSAITVYRQIIDKTTNLKFKNPLKRAYSKTLQLHYWH